MTNNELKLNDLKAEIKKLSAHTTIPYDVEQAFRKRLLPDGFIKFPRDAITAPSGGGTQDAEARTAINSIITALEDLGLIRPN